MPRFAVARQAKLPLQAQSELLPVAAGPCALEDDAFPFETLSVLAEVESWRKEINRPIYHLHKWWAQRLGSVFRAVVLGAFSPKGADVMAMFYKPVTIPDATVFDPFMGSGTTVGEALKLGCRAVGRDINPVAHFQVRTAMAVHRKEDILREYELIERDVAKTIRSFYRAKLADGSVADVLYYFWVKEIDCPECAASVDLFSSYVFAQHAYRKRFPQAQALCPHCGEVNPVRFDAEDAKCVGCRQTFNPQAGPARGQNATCRACSTTFSISKTVRRGADPPRHRLYAKLVLLKDGSKEYQRATVSDFELFAKAKRALAEGGWMYPEAAIEPGYNTDQALGYNYRYWRQMFNERQLLCLSMLAKRISEIADVRTRELFVCLFSGALEFNNLFASYKGEGTGAVRHMFSHHILKPERVPLEANPWGTPKSSGSFSTMFEGRIRRALDYADNPFELIVAKRGEKAAKVYSLSEPIGFDIATTYRQFAAGKRVYLSCGDSGAVDLPDASVDAVITDPPFFDNVHYSQLADFFYVWQQHILSGAGKPSAKAVTQTTRSNLEVQNGDAEIFTERLASVWREVRRVLKDEGLLVFSYHHSRPEGWSSVLRALMLAGFVVTAVQPVKSEMSVAVPKNQAKEPIDLDILIVCRKAGASRGAPRDPWRSARPAAAMQVERFRAAGRRLSRNDVRVIVTSQLIRELSAAPSAEAAIAVLDKNEGEIETVIDELHDGRTGNKTHANE